MALESIPRSCYKYYKSGDINDFVKADLATEEQATLIADYVQSVCKIANIEFLGYAFAKDAYMRELVDAGYGVLFIVRQDGEKFLVDIQDDGITKISRPFLDSIFEK